MAGEAAKTESERVRELIERDRAERQAEEFRRESEERFEAGSDRDAANAVVSPTPEWEQHGDFETYIPRQPDGSVRVVRTVRRMKVPLVTRLERKGEVSAEGAAACRWYATLHEMTGTIGLIPSTDMGKEVFAAPQDRVAFTERQQQAQSDFRAARCALPARYLRFFDAVVLGDIPMHRAARFARIRKSNAAPKFRTLAETLAEYRKAAEGD